MTKAITYFEEWLKFYNPQAKKCCVLYGPTGSGKTFTVKTVAEKLGYKVVVITSMDELEYKDIVRIVQTRSLFSKKLVLLDRPYEFLGSLEIKKIIAKAKIPVVIECDEKDRKYYQVFGCSEIRVEPPPLHYIVKEVKNKAIVRPDFRKITTDFRQALQIALGSNGYEMEKTWTDRVRDYFRRKETRYLEETHEPVLLDTGLKCFYGVNLVKFIQALVSSDLVKKYDILKDVSFDRKVADVELYFYMKLKAFKEAQK